MIIVSHLEVKLDIPRTAFPSPLSGFMDQKSQPHPSPQTQCSQTHTQVGGFSYVAAIRGTRVVLPKAILV